MWTDFSSREAVPIIVKNLNLLTDFTTFISNKVPIKFKIDRFLKYRNKAIQNFKKTTSTIKV